MVGDLRNRIELLDFVESNGVNSALELGVFRGEYSQSILERTGISKLYLVDPWAGTGMRQQWNGEEAYGQVQRRLRPFGNRVELLRMTGDEADSQFLGLVTTFDFIYIDGDHSYEGIVKDLEQAVRKVKPDGWIVCNDYTIFSPIENTKYGVYRAVNELCLEHDWEIVYMGLHRWGYHDVALRRRQVGADGS